MLRDRMLLYAFLHLVEEKLGLDFPPEKFPDLEAALRSAESRAGVASAAELFRILDKASLSDPVWGTLQDTLTVGETYFFRDRAQLETIQAHVFQSMLAGAPRTIHLWSAGCSTGEEAFSLAILASETFPANAGWHVQVLGTDLSDAFLKKARDGLYPEWSFRGMDEAVRSAWFLKQGRQWSVHPSLRPLVSFRQHNLVLDPMPGPPEGFDLILCRNVFVYFKPRTVREVIHRFNAVLKPTGALVLGHSEMGIDPPSCFLAEVHSNAMILRSQRYRALHSPVPSLAAPEKVRLLPVVTDRKNKGPAPPAGGQAPKKNYIDVLTEAQRSLDSGNNSRALKLATEALEHPIVREEAIAVSAQALANMGRVEEGLARVDDSLRHNPASSRLLYLRSLLTADLGREGEARKILDAVLTLSNDHVPALVDRSRMLEMHGHYQEAAADLERAIRRLESLEPGAPVAGMEPVPAAEVLTHCRKSLERCRNRHGDRR